MRRFSRSLAAAIRRERQTGFLFPVLGSSSRKGFYAEIPFFWAINESQDLTVAFHAYEARGFGGRILYRYRLAEDHGGTFGGFYVHESQVKGDDRGWGTFRHEWRHADGWRAVADVNYVSDDLVLREVSALVPAGTGKRSSWPFSLPRKLWTLSVKARCSAGTT